MTRGPAFLALLPLFPTLFVHLVGVVVAIVLIVRRERRRGSAILALVGFTLLTLVDLASFARGSLIGLLAPRVATGIQLASTSVGCCFSVFEVAAVLCLIAAIWRAVSHARTSGAGSETSSATTEEG